MALINRIEIVNYLCEGWQPSMGIESWRPLWPANLITLCGQSTAIQIPNGCGKTSVTSAILYLLSRDRTLKRQFLERCAPAGTVSTHVRVEFAILMDESLTQRDLMTRDPLSCPAQTYVIGVCGNRGDETPQFYRYPGLLEDVPACRMEGTAIEFASTDTLRAGVKKIRSGQWGGWDTISEWSKVVGEFMSPEVVRQNVQFHRSGAGDASATFSKVVPGPGERFDEAYFRQVVAPQLLSNVMGDSSEEDERNIEDTILNSMNRFIAAKLQVERKRAYLDRREAMEVEFQPVLEAARSIQAAENQFQVQLQRLAVDAAFLERFAAAKDGRIGGVPRPLTELSFGPKVRTCLESMVLDKDGSILIESAGVAKLVGLSTGHLNQSAARTTTTRGVLASSPISSQAIDLYRDIKSLEGSGGRRKSMVFYSRPSALELISRRPEATEDQSEVIAEAFAAAEQLVDTNPFRHEHRRLVGNRLVLKEQIAAAELEGRESEVEKERLEKQVKERMENQGAFQEFCGQQHLLPSELHDAPGNVPDWLAAQTRRRTDAVSSHAERVGTLTAGWDELRSIRNELGLLSIETRIEELNLEGQRVEQVRGDLEAAMDRAQNRRDDAASGVSSTRTGLSETALELALLGNAQESHSTYLSIFGDADPLEVGPPVEEQKSLARSREQTAGKRRVKVTEHGHLVELGKGLTAFRGLFGDLDPHQTKPQADLDKLLESQRAAEQVFSQHQPLAESLEEHRARTDREPSTWLSETDASYARALDSVRKAEARTADLARALAALDNLDLVGDADYAAAHLALEESGIEVTRVRDAILKLGQSKNKALPLLAAFGPLLNAPVVVDLTAADAALATLQAGDHDVPIVLLEPLLDALKSDFLLETPSAAALLFLAGAKSRRVRAIVDPQALEEERGDLQSRHKEQEDAAGDARDIAATLSPHTDEYRLALRAQEAVKLHSLERADAAQAELSTLEPRINVARKLTTPEALRSIADAVQYLKAGGDAALALLANEMSDLAAALEKTEVRIGKIAPLLTQGAMVAHDGARKFVLGGGQERLTQLQSKQASLTAELAVLEDELSIAEPALATTRVSLAAAQLSERAFMETFNTSLSRLTRAASFESDGSATFMADQAKTREALVRERDALDPLRAINYFRAQAFKDHQGQDEAELQRLIGEAKTRRGEAATKAQELTGRVEKLDGLVQAFNAAAESLHELAYFLIERRRSVVPFEADLKSREGGASQAESHLSFQTTNDLRLRLMDWRPSDAPIDRTLIAGVREDVESIDVAKTGQEVTVARKYAVRTAEAFEKARNAFCEKARSAEDGAFSEAEIEAIGHARTAEDLQELGRIGVRLHQDLELEKSDLQELERSATTIESESINTLTRLVESCKSNLTTMNAVMAKNPNARFIIATNIISTADIKKLLLDLRDHIEVRKREAAARTTLTRKSSTDTNLGSDVRRALIDRIFTDPSVEFRHVGMWEGKTQPIQPSLSEGQKSALQMMWLIKESEYHLECAVRRHLGGGSKKKLRSRSQRILFFDGLFSNLTDRALIDEAFKGLGEADSNLQLIGLIHNPEYRNNAAIFPTLVVGRRVGRRDVEGERSFVKFEDGRPDGSMGLATFMLKRSASATGIPARG